MLFRSRRAPAPKGATGGVYRSGVVARLQQLVRDAARGDVAASRELARMKERASSGDAAARREWAAAVATMRADDTETDRAFLAALGRRRA